jgi:trans-aconitate methyltransferase
MNYSTSVPKRAKQIIADHKGDDYTAFHSQRYAVLLELLARYAVDSQAQILDIGRSRLTEMIANEFGAVVDSLGFPPDGSTNTGNHYHYDLNSTQFKEEWRTSLPRYNVIVIAEVLEHLYTSPTWVLGYLKSLLLPGGIIVVQTPNALALSRRLRLLLGLHPYQLINEDHTEPWHYREYTEKELRNYATKLELKVLDCTLSSYFDGRYVSHIGNSRPVIVGTLLNVLYSKLPRNLRLGITISLQSVSS